MRAIVLAAGTGSRLAEVTNGRHKALLPLHGRPLLQHHLRALEMAGVDEVVVVTGHDAEAVRAAAGGRASFRHFPGFATANNLATLRAHGDLLEGTVLVSFADVLVAHAPLRRLVACTAPLALLVDPGTPRHGTMAVRHDGEGVLDIGPDIDPQLATGNFIGVLRSSAPISSAIADALDATRGPGADGFYYTEALRRLPVLGEVAAAVEVRSDQWLEVDTPADYAAAQAADFYLA